MNAKDIITDLGDAQGWEPDTQLDLLCNFILDTQLDLLCNFIDERDLTQSLQKFLQAVADEENEYKSD